MLRRDRQIRIQILQLADAIFFGFSLWLAFVVRLNPEINAWLSQWFGAGDIFVNGVGKNDWLYFVIGLASPLILESQHFYEHPPLASRWKFFWSLLKSCFLITVCLVLAVYAFHQVMPRGVTTFFGLIGFALMWSRQELLRFIIKSKFGQSQYKRRVALVGASDELSRLARELEGKRDGTVAIVTQFDLARPVGELVQLLHEHAISSVILSAKRTYFEQIENVIKACELEGIEVWLLADFFTTQISKTTSDELLGRPLLIFSTVPETSWQSIVKQVLDFFGALILLVIASPVFLIAAIAIKSTSPGPIFSNNNAPASTARHSSSTNFAPWSPTPSNSNTNSKR